MNTQVLIRKFIRETLNESLNVDDLIFQDKGDQINFSDSAGGSGFLVIKNGHPYIVDWHSVPISKRYGEEENQLKRRGFARKVIQGIKGLGYKDFYINKPSNDAQAALKRMTEQGLITPVPGSERGISVAEYFTHYTIN